MTYEALRVQRALAERRAQVAQTRAALASAEADLELATARAAEAEAERDRWQARVGALWADYDQRRAGRDDVVRARDHLSEAVTLAANCAGPATSAERQVLRLRTTLAVLATEIAGLEAQLASAETAAAQAPLAVQREAVAGLAQRVGGWFGKGGAA